MIKIFKLVLNLFFLLGFIPIVISAAVISDSSIEKNTIWTVKDSPYIIEKNLTIAKGAKLIIEPGVTIKFNPNEGKPKIKLIVNGTLEAKGLESNMINFTSDSFKSGSWGGIIFEKNNSTEKSIIQYCNIEYATCGIGCFSSSPIIINNNFKINEVSIVCENHSSPLIGNNYITQNGTFQSTAGGIACSLYSNPEISQNKIEKNIGYGIYVSTFSSPRITNNTITQNRGRGLVVFSKSTPSIINNDISLNSCSCGIIVYQSNPTIIGNNIHENRSQGIGITLGSSSVVENNNIHENGNGVIIICANPTIVNNTIKNNKGAAISIWDDANPVINNNQIEVKEDSPIVRFGRLAQAIDMQFNWWGTSDKKIIEQNIVNMAEKDKSIEKINFLNFQIKDSIALQAAPNQIATSTPNILKNNPWNIYGEKVLFVSFKNNNWDICMTNMEGSEINNLTDNNLFHDIYPIFSPDGQNIVYSSRRNGNLDLYTMDLRTSAIKQVTDTISSEEFPTWSPDGKQIAFKQIENLEDYYVIDADGQNRTKTDVAQEGYHNVLFMWMPVNKLVLSKM
ncbi:right-handed parallel beta-helix repeat-containing protein [Candidatus Poribacteria bacterium]|nr:right-handed parallel beta-helix repeat-containing protein [Candidatus Poribacteria bacterium]